MLVSGAKETLDKLRQSLRAVANDKSILGRFHFDFETSDAWTKKIAGAKGKNGIVVIHPGEFGMDGKVLAQLPLDAGNQDILTSLVKANKTFASTTAKKVYRQHVAKGRQLGIFFEGAVPYGEDRDGDGEFDKRTVFWDRGHNLSGLQIGFGGVWGAPGCAHGAVLE
ncbi:MAG: hypothetical protein IH991_06435, partial [Planctomycetes bacterium]|nr:hypothetical protein [Planctomycetota bacterium]